MIVVCLLLCDCNSLGWFFLVAIVDSPCDSDLLVVVSCKIALAFVQLRDVSCFAGNSTLLVAGLAGCVRHLVGMLSFRDSTSRCDS